MLALSSGNGSRSGSASSSDFLLHCTSGLDATTFRLYAAAKMLGLNLKRFHP